MEQNFVWINCEKEEYLSAIDFEESTKIDGYLHNRGRCNNALYTLMGNRWKDDHIILIGEKQPEEGLHQMVSDLAGKFDDLDCLGSIWFGSQIRFRNAAELFLSDESKEETIYYRYVINQSRREFYRRRSLKDKNMWFNPLTYLLICAEGYSKGSYGKWIGDSISVSNDDSIMKDPEYRNMTSIYVYQYFLGGEDVYR